MAWTNAALKNYFDEFGERINSISLNNGKYLLIGYRDGTVRLSDIEFIEYDGVELMRVHHTQQQGDRVLKWHDDLTTEFVEGVDVMSEEDIDYRLDPLTLK